MEKGHTRDIGRDGPRHHTWPYSDEVIEFEDTIIISDEVPPLPQHEGKSLTLWTEAREKNQLIEDNKRCTLCNYLLLIGKALIEIFSACPTDTILLGSHNVSKD